MKKLSYLLAIAIVLSGLAFSNSVNADNNRENDNGTKNFKEAHENGTTLEVHLYDNGTVLVRGAKVTGVTGNVISASTSWGSTVLNWAVNADTGVKIMRRYGGISSVSEISVGDLISFHGKMVTTVASPLTVNADTLKDWSIQKKAAAFSGSVKSIDTANMKFVLSSEGKEATILATSATKITKDDVVATFADITVGAKVSTRGMLNTVTNILSADTIKISKPKAERTVVGGTLKSIAGTTAPTSLVMTSGDKEYTVNIASDTAVLNSNWLKVTLSTFKVGDSIQVYGLVNTNMTIDATVVRAAKLK